MPFRLLRLQIPKSYAYRLLLYIITHGYEGRLGMELINRRGSPIDSSYNSDGHGSWISMTMGVNPDKLQVVRSVFEQIIEDYRRILPAEQDLAEAKQHFIGRRISADQSNEELSAFYAREWIEQGRLADQREFEKKVRAVTGEEVSENHLAILAWRGRHD